jgi:hypothetical protein
MESDMTRDGAGPTAEKYPAVSSWVGWIAFAAVGMVVVGAFHLVQGLVALVSGMQVVVRRPEPLLDLGATAWGAVHLLVGGVVVVAGLCVFAGQRWARGVGVLMATVSMVVNFGFVGADPVRSVVIIAVDLVIVLALTVHGSDIKP